MHVDCTLQLRVGASWDAEYDENDWTILHGHDRIMVSNGVEEWWKVEKEKLLSKSASIIQQYWRGYCKKRRK